jgi:hypothetical protein
MPEYIIISFDEIKLKGEWREIDTREQMTFYEADGKGCKVIVVRKSKKKTFDVASEAYSIQIDFEIIFWEG